MDPRFDDSGNAVPPAFHHAVTCYAHAVGLPADLLVRGECFSHDEARFWFMQYGDADPDALTVLMDAGAPPADPRACAALTSALLDFNGLVPAALHGYYGYMPHLGRIVFCQRIALGETDDPAAAIVAVIQRSIECRREARGVFEGVSQPLSSN